MKKTVSLFLTCLLLVSLLVSCNGQTPPKSTAAPVSTAAPSATQTKAPASSSSAETQPETTEEPVETDPWLDFTEEFPDIAWKDMSQEEQRDYILLMEGYYAEPAGKLADYFNANGIERDPYWGEYTDQDWLCFVRSVSGESLENTRGLKLPDEAASGLWGEELPIENNDPRVIRFLNLFNDSLATQSTVVEDSTLYWETLEQMADFSPTPCMVLSYFPENAWVTEDGCFTKIYVTDMGVFAMDPNREHTPSLPFLGDESTEGTEDLDDALSGLLGELLGEKTYPYCVMSCDPYAMQGAVGGSYRILWSGALEFTAPAPGITLG